MKMMNIQIVVIMELIQRIYIIIKIIMINISKRKIISMIKKNIN